MLEAIRRREQEQVIRNGKTETGERGGGTKIGRRGRDGAMRRRLNEVLQNTERVTREGDVMDRKLGCGRGSGQRQGRHRDGKEAEEEVSCRGPAAGEERKGRAMGNGELLPPVGDTNPCALLAGSLGPSS